MPILVLSSKRALDQLARKSVGPYHTHVGLSIGGKRKDQRNSYLAAPLALVRELLDSGSELARGVDAAIAPHRERLAAIDDIEDQVLDELIERFSTDRLFPRSLRAGFDSEDLWSAVILAWVLENNPRDYVSGARTLWQVFMDSLGIKERIGGGFLRKHIAHQLFGGRKTNLYYELAAWVDLEHEHRARIQQLASLEALYEEYAKLGISLILLVASGGTSLWVQLAADVLDGLVGLAAEFEKAKRDGKITEAEADAILIAGVFTMLPFTSLLKGTLRRAAEVFNATAFATIVVLILCTLVRELIHALGKLERQQQAQEAGISTIEEHALDQWVVIQYAD